MYVHRTSHRRVDFQPVSDNVDFAEGNAGLGHSPGAGVHPEQQDLLRTGSVTLDVKVKGLAGVFQRIVHVAYRRREFEWFQGLDKLIGDRL